MKRVFIDNMPQEAQEFTVDAAEEHHLKHVMRIKKGDQVLLFDGKSDNEGIGIIKKIHPKIVISLTKIQAKKLKKPFGISLAFGLLKGNKNDFIIEKATEIGVDEILPFISQHSAVSPAKEQQEKKHNRLKRIAVAASKQCGRSVIPELYPLLPFREVLKRCNEYAGVLAADTKQRVCNIADFLSKAEGNFLVIVGPEGGFSVQERNDLEDKGKIFSLGSNILRAETASLVAVSLVSYELNLLHNAGILN